MSEDYTFLMANIVKKFEFLDSKPTADDYWRISASMDEMEGVLREKIQAMSEGEIQHIVRKLESNQHLNQEEVEYVKLWICGDADYYAKVENNYQDWIEELKRIIEAIKTEQVKEQDVHTSAVLRAMLKDGMRVISDIMFFLRQKERIENFSDSTKEIDEMERKYIVGLLTRKIESEKL